MAGLLIALSVSSNHQTSIVQSAKAAQFLRLNIPAVVHGFEKMSQLPDGDLFLLPDPLQMAITDAPEGAKVFAIGLETFGGNAESIGALPGIAPHGLTLSTPNSKVVAKSCSESIWDSNFVLAATPGTVGDTVRFFLEQSDGGKGPELALFTIKNSGVEVTQLHSDLMLFVNNRFATGPSLMEGGSIAYAGSAGESGMRTDLLTFAWPMLGFSELQGCYRLGIEITRGDNAGTTSVVVTDVVVIRNRVTGDENNVGSGLLRSLRGGFPTGFPCKAECPFPPEPPVPPVPNPGPDASNDCITTCFRSPQYFRLNIDRLPDGTVLIGGFNSNIPVCTDNQRVIGLALRGGYTPLQKLNQEFVTAQLNILSAGCDGSPIFFSAMEGRLSCYGLDFDEITLSNGFILSPDTKLKDLYQQTRFAISDNRANDQIVLTQIFDLLNGNNPLGVCNNLW
jgi:hypothetical protein